MSEAIPMGLWGRSDRVERLMVVFVLSDGTAAC